MESQQERLKNICDYIDTIVRSDVTVFSIQMKALKQDIERSLLRNREITPEIEFLIKHL